MTNIITSVSKYITLLCMALYTLRCYTFFVAGNEKKRKRIINKQIAYMFIIHFIMNMTIFINVRELRILVLYLSETAIAILYMSVFTYAYKYVSRILVNNVTFLLLTGFTILTRLDFESAVRQFVLASICLFVTSFIPLILKKIKSEQNWSVFYSIAGIVFLLTVFIPGLGVTKYGSSNWISVFGISIQPMEFVKILFILFVASGIFKAEKIKDFFINACVAALFVLILAAENDFGACLIFYICYIMMVYLATGRSIFMFAGFALLAIAVAGGYVLFKDSLFAHIMVRVDAWKDPFANRDTGGYQVSESLFAIGTGGFTGTGLTRGMPNLVPVVNSDFIFSAICEELGALFGACLVLVYLSMFITIQNIAMKCTDPFYKYVTYGIGMTFIFQVFLNVGGVTKFIPSTGITLPLISAGISSLSSTLIMFGIVQYSYMAVVRESEKYVRAKERYERQLEFEEELERS